MRLTGLEGCVAVVTGAASGIGQAVVRRLARERVRLAVVDVYEAGLRQLCAGLADAAPAPVVADLSDPHEVMDLAKRVLGEVGDVSFLVNLAGGPVAPSHEDQLPRLPTRAFPIEEIDDAAAAHTVFVGIVNSFGTPAQKGATLALLDQAYAASIARVSDGPARNKGVAVGRAAGAAILALRKDDNATRDAPYTPGMGPGKWRPHP